MDIEFTTEEKKEFLIKQGYTIEEYVGERDRDFYQGDKGIVIINVEIAYAYTKPEGLDNLDLYHIRDRFSVHEVFKRVMTQKIKRLLL